MNKINKDFKETKNVIIELKYAFKMIKNRTDIFIYFAYSCLYFLNSLIFYLRTDLKRDIIKAANRKLNF